MKAIKNLEPFAQWILRVSALALVISLYHSQLATFDFKSVSYIINLIYTSFFVLLFIGGFQKGQTLTIISGLFITLISVYKIYIAFDGQFLNVEMYRFCILLGIGLLFASRGNS